jgi:HEAT repeat protein
MPVLTIDFSDIIRAVYWLAGGGVTLSVLLVFCVTLMRRSADARAQREKKIRKMWLNVLQLGTGRLPRLQKQEIPVFLLLWNEAQEAACALGDQPHALDVRTHLQDIAHRLGVERIARRLLRSRETATRLIAIETLGYLRETGAVAQLRTLTESESSLLSFASARALLQINHDFAERFVALMCRRTDWPPARLETIVEEERTALAAPVTERIGAAPAELARKLVPYLAFFGPARSLPVVRHVLERCDDVLTLCAVLKVLGRIGSAEDAPLAATFAAHEDWRVRVQSANALGLLGDASQIPLLAVLLNDAHWWVRYRSAQAIARLDRTGTTELANLLRTLQDRYARDIVAQVINEQLPVIQGASTV